MSQPNPTYYERYRKAVPFPIRLLLSPLMVFVLILIAIFGLLLLLSGEAGKADRLLDRCFPSS